jgi:hypothetical protein
MAKLDAKQVAAKLTEAMGNIAAVARAFGVSRQAVAAFISRRPSLQAILQEARETMIDHAESAVFAAVLNGDLSAAKYVLSTVGKGRGWCDLASDVEQLRVQLETLVRQHDNGNTRTHRTSA